MMLYASAQHHGYGAMESALFAANKEGIGIVSAYHSQNMGQSAQEAERAPRQGELLQAAKAWVNPAANQRQDQAAASKTSALLLAKVGHDGGSSKIGNQPAGDSAFKPIMFVSDVRDLQNPTIIEEIVHFVKEHPATVALGVVGLGLGVAVGVGIGGGTAASLILGGSFGGFGSAVGLLLDNFVMATTTNYGVGSYTRYPD